MCVLVAASKGEAEPERKETRTKVDEDRKHEYPLLTLYNGQYMFSLRFIPFRFRWMPQLVYIDIVVFLFIH